MTGPTPDPFVCYHCREHRHTACVGCPYTNPYTPEKGPVTSHDAATRERVRSRILHALSRTDFTWPTEIVETATDAALSALQPPPKGWEVSNATEAGYRSGTDAYDGHSNNWFMDEEGIASRKAGLRSATPHLLRDLADGLSGEIVGEALDRAENESVPADSARRARRLLRALADTLEGK